jgi:hypothetical protein
LKDHARAFDFDLWFACQFRRNAGYLVDQDLLADSDARAADLLLNTPNARAIAQKNLVFSNGDCQFRNFIRQANEKIVLIDWTSNPPDLWISPGFEPLEHIAMYIWTLMWGNPEWQRDFFAKITTAVGLTDNRLRQALLIKSFNQAYFWQSRGHRALAKQQIEHFLLALRDEWPRVF